MAFHVGQKVEFVKPNWSPAGFRRLPIGFIGTVSWVGTGHWCGKSYEVIRLVEAPVPTGKAWAAEQFRPLTDRKSEVSFTMGADPESEKWDNRKVKVRS